MDKVADFIENWILSRIKSDKEQVIILRRNELAEELECAPSQISYVLSTRFTVERGYIVESRRGSGGYVRIARIPIQTIVLENAVRQIGRDIPAETFRQMLTRLRNNGLMTEREAALISQFFDMMVDRVSPDEKTRMIQRILLTLLDRRDI